MDVLIMAKFQTNLRLASLAENLGGSQQAGPEPRRILCENSLALTVVLWLLPSVNRVALQILGAHRAWINILWTSAKAVGFLYSAYCR